MKFSIEYYWTFIQPSPVLVFGILLMFGVMGGMIANRHKWMPTITAFMLLGLIIGPNGLGLINKKMMDASTILIDIALGLILYKLGNMLHPKAMLKSRKLLVMGLSEAAFSFIAVLGLMLAMGYDLLLSIFIGAIAVSSSPAVLVHVAEEMNASGPVTDRAKSLVAMNNIFSFLIFSLTLPFAMTNEETSLGSMFIMPMYKLFGAAVVGIIAAWIAIRIARLLHKRDEHYRFAIVIGAVMLTLGISEMIHASALFSPLVLGIATRWFETSKHNLSRVGLGEGGDLFFIVLFVMAGAKIDPMAIVATGLVPVLLVIVRSCGKFAGVFLVSPFSGFDGQKSAAVGYLLIPMAGMAIGLAATTTDMLPTLGASISSIVFTMVALFETIGPFAAAHAFRMCGEANDEEDEEDAPPPKDGGGSAKQQQPAFGPLATASAIKSGLQRALQAGKPKKDQ
ncbi:MAG: cation:proton antiporter [Alphaproteobacteria bacterium]|nr:cation:proton antiporter [Alphaproteobacteria bacterium]